MQIGRGQRNNTSNLLMVRIYGNINRERENRLGGTALWAICCDGEWIYINIDLS